MLHQDPPTFSTSGLDAKSAIDAPKSSITPLTSITDTVSAAQDRYISANQKSLQAYNEACDDLPGGNTRTVLHSSPFPITFVNGEGCKLKSLDGDVYTDFLGEYSAGIYGHSNQQIASAVSRAMNNGWNFGGPNTYERELAKKVTQRFAPSGIELVRFTNSGTEANTMALAAAVAFTKRKTILAFQNGYHGGTLSFPKILNPINVNLPHDFVYAPYNDVPGTLEVLSNLPTNSLAAIIVEPMQGSGGCIVGRKDFLQFLNSQAHKLGALFIVDEVMSSRLAYHGLSYQLGLTPDLVTVGKWIGGGMTFGAFGGRKDGGVMSMFDPRTGVLGHSGTFNNNIITMAAGCAGLDIYGEDKIRELNALGAKLKTKIEGVLLDHEIQSKPALSGFTAQPTLGIANESEVGRSNGSVDEEQDPVMWVSGQGSMMNIHFSGENKDDLRVLFWHHMLEDGIYMAQRGFVAMNIELNEGHIESFARAVDTFVKKYQNLLV